MPPVVRAQLDYYAVLEVPPSADTAEVNAAFRRLAWRYHPDRNPAPGSTLQFQDINEAHQVLSDPARRADYDARWHPRAGRRRPATHMPVRPRPPRRWCRHRHMRAVLLTVFAVLFVSSAWAMILTAMTASHTAEFKSSIDTAMPSRGQAPSSCGLSMEMFPVTYVDEHGRAQTAWETDVHNCYGGSTRLSAVPAAGQARSGRFASGPLAR